MADAKLHWSAEFIGRPYVGGTGPDAFNCWSLCRAVWKARLGVDVPDLNINPADAIATRRAFRDRVVGGTIVPSIDVATPIELDAVYMTRRGLPDHIGIWIEAAPAAGVLHVFEGACVTFNRAATLRALGMSVVSYHRLAGV